MGVIHLLPALPEAWAEGDVRGLRARGGYEVDIRWEREGTFEAKLRPSVNGACSLRAPVIEDVLQQGIQSLNRNELDSVIIQVEAGREYVIKGIY
jgi:alpha-L-fucosidase 2